MSLKYVTGLTNGFVVFLRDSWILIFFKMIMPIISNFRKLTFSKNAELII